MKRPSFQFYPGDWLRSTDLRSCSLEARGLWIDILCLMHEGTPYGYLRVNKKVITEVNLASMVGVNLEVVRRLTGELEESGVFSRDTDGCIYSRRMVKDEEIRVKRAAGGSLGGNPALIKPSTKVNLEENHHDKQTVADGDEEEEADESHPLVVVKNPTRKELALTTELPPNLDTEGFRIAWAEWVEYRWESHKPMTGLTVKGQLRDFGAVGPERAVEMIRQSIRNGWQGIFEPKGTSNGKPAAESRRAERAAREHPETLTL